MLVYPMSIYVSKRLVANNIVNNIIMGTENNYFTLLLMRQLCCRKTFF